MVVPRNYMNSDKPKKGWAKKTFPKKNAEDSSNSNNWNKKVPVSSSTSKMPSKGFALIYKVILITILSSVLFLASVFCMDNYVLNKNKPLMTYYQEILGHISKQYAHLMSMVHLKSSSKSQEMVHDYLLMVAKNSNAIIKFFYDHMMTGVTEAATRIPTIFKQMEKTSPIYVEEFMKVLNSIQTIAVDYIAQFSSYMKNEVFVGELHPCNLTKSVNDLYQKIYTYIF